MRWMCVTAVLLGSCFGATPAERERARAIAALAADVEVGGQRYADSCASCHGTAGEGLTGPGLAEASGLPRDELVLILMWGPGEMPTFEAWSDQDLADVSAFVQEGL